MAYALGTRKLPNISIKGLNLSTNEQDCSIRKAHMACWKKKDV